MVILFLLDLPTVIKRYLIIAYLWGGLKTCSLLVNKMLGFILHFAFQIPSDHLRFFVSFQLFAWLWNYYNLVWLLCCIEKILSINYTINFKLLVKNIYNEEESDYKNETIKITKKKSHLALNSILLEKFNTLPIFFLIKFHAFALYDTKTGRKKSRQSMKIWEMWIDFCEYHILATFASYKLARIIKPFVTIRMGNLKRKDL